MIFHASHISSSVSKENIDVSNEEEEIVPVKQVNIPTWSAFNSLTCTALPLTVVGTPPLLAEPAHEWQTLITVLKQAQHINAVIVGPNHKTLITLDMALYERAKKLEMLRDDCKNQWILRIGESTWLWLHFVL